MLRSDSGTEMYDVGLNNESGYVIAEVGSNHDRNLKTALAYINAASKMGADAVKFQFFDADDLVSENHPARAEVEGYVTPIEWIPELVRTCGNNGVDFFASTFNINLFKILDSSDVKLHKIASSEVLNAPLLIAAARSNKPILISFGMSEWYEVEIAMKILLGAGAKNVIPMHCTAKYPLPLGESNLSIIPKLIERFGGPVGFSDHTQSVEVGGWAAMLGARIFEKHITLDRTLPGADHNYALEPIEFQTYVRNIRNSISSIGLGEKKYLSDELVGRRRLGLRARNAMSAGRILSQLDFETERPRTEIPENLLTHLKNVKLRNNLEAGHDLRWEDLS